MIELDPEQLPSGDEVLSILQQERSQLNVWINVAVSKLNLKLSSVLDEYSSSAFNNDPLNSFTIGILMTLRLSFQ